MESKSTMMVLCTKVIGKTMSKSLALSHGLMALSTLASSEVATLKE